jgi:hypothetical protein
MKAWTRREKVFAVALAAILLMGAATVTRTVDWVNVLSVSSISSGATPLAVVAHVQIVNHVSSVTHMNVAAVGDLAQNSTLSSLGAANTITNLEGYSTAIVQLTAMSANIGVVFETANDGSTFVSRAAVDNNGVPILTATAAGVYVVPINGVQAFRTRIADFTSGSVVSRIRLSRATYSPTVSHQGASSKTGFYCHTQANFVTSAPETIVAHTGNSQRLYICGIVLTPTQDEQVVLVEGTTAGCKTGTLGVWPGASAPHLAAVWHVSTTPIVGAVQGTSWLSTQTAGNPLCVHKQNATSRVSGIVTYGAYPDRVGGQ